MITKVLLKLSIHTLIPQIIDMSTALVILKVSLGRKICMIYLFILLCNVNAEMSPVKELNLAFIIIEVDILALINILLRNP